MILTAQGPLGTETGRAPRNGNVPAGFPPIDLAKTIRHRWAISDKHMHEAPP
jgi:hypothetical protein